MKILFPLNISELTLWLAIMSIILIPTTEILNPFYGETSLVIRKKRLRKITLITSFVFIFTILLRIYLTITQ